MNSFFIVRIKLKLFHDLVLIQLVVLESCTYKFFDIPHSKNGI